VKRIRHRVHAGPVAQRERIVRACARARHAGLERPAGVAALPAVLQARLEVGAAPPADREPLLAIQPAGPRGADLVGGAGSATGAAVERIAPEVHAVVRAIGQGPRAGAGAPLAGGVAGAGAITGPAVEGVVLQVEALPPAEGAPALADAGALLADRARIAHDAAGAAVLGVVAGDAGLITPLLPRRAGQHAAGASTRPAYGRPPAGGPGAAERVDPARRATTPARDAATRPATLVEGAPGRFEHRLVVDLAADREQGAGERPASAEDPRRLSSHRRMAVPPATALPLAGAVYGLPQASERAPARAPRWCALTRGASAGGDRGVNARSDATRRCVTTAARPATRASAPPRWPPRPPAAA
jgi:hypothetical protein